MRGTGIAGLLAAATGTLLLSGSGTAQQAKATQRPAACAALKSMDFGEGVRILSAEPVAEAPAGTLRANPMSPPIAVAIPPLCKVTGTINARTGAGGKPFALGFEVALPDKWNGRFLMQGGGGLNGTLNPALGAVAAGDVPALARGFAVASTDGGHRGAVFDFAFQADQRAALDFALASVPTVATLAKRIVAARYGAPAHHSYMTGCSTGGREGMLAAQRFPELFDGVIVGAPAMRTGWSNLGMAHAAVAFNQAAPRDAQGTPIPSRIFSEADRKTILQGMLAQCDGLDGLKDGVIDNVAACNFDPARLQCSGAKGDDCLSAAQVKAMQEAYRSPKDTAGNDLYAAYPYDTGNVETGPGIPGFLPTGGPGIFGPANVALTLDADEGARKVRADGMQMLTDTNIWTNLSTFLGRGGKILFFHGVSDPWFSANDTLDYFHRAEAANGPANWANASRFYMVPGMSHCGGGANSYSSFDMLTSLVNWVEKGVPAAAVPASRTLPTPAKRPLCPFPQYARFNGTGDSAKPESYSCAGTYTKAR